MSLLHISLPADDPEQTARVLADMLHGTALAFPPCPSAWIAFSGAGDGTAIELYPPEARIEPGPDTITFTTHAPKTGPIAAHAAIATPRPAAEIVDIGQDAGWQTRICDRGPFQLVEVWIDNRTLIEVLDPDMLRTYRASMTAANWRAMFGL